jgi:hypothetical protein
MLARVKMCLLRCRRTSSDVNGVIMTIDELKQKTKNQIQTDLSSRVEKTKQKVNELLKDLNCGDFTYDVPLDDPYYANLFFKGHLPIYFFTILESSRNPFTVKGKSYATLGEALIAAETISPIKRPFR